MISHPAFIIKRVRYSVIMGKGTIMKVRFPLLLFLGIVFLASATVSFGLAYREKENPISHNKCLQNHSRCKLIKNHESEEWEGREEQHESRQPWRESGSHESEEEEERDPRKQPHRRHQEQEQESEGQRGRGEEEEEEHEKEQERQQSGRGREQEEEKGEWRGERHREDPEYRERIRRRDPRQREERGQRPKKREQHEEREGQSSRSQRQDNPFHFSSDRFQTRYKNRNGHIRVLQRFDKRSSKLQNLQNYRIVEYESRPNTLVLPHHSDAEYILVVLKGRATITVVKSNDKQAYNLEYGDVLRLPAGTTAHILNRDDNQNLRVVKLAIPVNKPGQFDDFFPSSTENQQSYFRGFSRNTLEAAFNTRYEEIQRILLGEEEQEQEQGQEQQSQEEGVIVKVSKEHIKELSRHAQSSSRRGKHSESGPFNLRSNKPIYSNKFGNFYEITPDKNPQLEDLELSLSYVEINEGALMLPHYNSEAIEIVVVSEGKGNLELVGLREQQQQQEQQEEEKEQHEEEGNRQVQRYRARLSPRDTFVIPSGYPVSVNASSNLYLLGFGINAENNQRNFLAGEDDNVISQLDRQVKEIAFPGSAQDVEWLINNQQQSYFASAQPQQSGEGRQRRRGPLSSILGAFY